jgi:hypothetical protein
MLSKMTANEAANKASKEPGQEAVVDPVRLQEAEEARQIELEKARMQARDVCWERIETFDMDPEYLGWKFWLNKATCKTQWALPDVFEDDEEPDSEESDVDG